MTREEQDEKEYQEFKAQHQERYRLIPDWALREFWLESRRLLNMRIKELEEGIGMVFSPHCDCNMCSTLKKLIEK